MSEKEKCIHLLDSVPAYKMGYVLAYLEGITADEAADDAYCEKLYQDYLNDPDPEKTQAVPIEQLATDLGVAL